MNKVQEEDEEEEEDRTEKKVKERERERMNSNGNWVGNGTIRGKNGKRGKERMTARHLNDDRVLLLDRQKMGRKNMAKSRKN